MGDKNDKRQKEWKTKKTMGNWKNKLGDKYIFVLINLTYKQLFTFWLIQQLFWLLHRVIAQG